MQIRQWCAALRLHSPTLCSAGGTEGASTKLLDLQPFKIPEALQVGTGSKGEFLLSTAPGRDQHNDMVCFWLLGTGKAEGRAKAVLEKTTECHVMR